jgi:chlorobactene glucosyltransferase
MMGVGDISFFAVAFWVEWVKGVFGVLVSTPFAFSSIEPRLAAAATVVLAGMTFMVVFNMLTAPRAESNMRRGKHSEGHEATRPKVSLMVPARNEAHNLPVLAEHLARINYPDLEIILLDDASEDGTGAALAALVDQVNASQSSEPGRVRVRALRGAPLPSNWLGKNWACHQLAQVSTGDVLIFCDADARPGPQSVSRTVDLLERYRVGCATLMPRQILGSWAERAVIPVLLHMSLMCFIPLALIPRLRWKRLGVGNGQWLAFSRKAYTAIGGHTAVRNLVVEDIALAQRAQTSGQGLVVALGATTLEVRMYRSAHEVWDGFGKNLFVLTGKSLLKAFFFGAFFTLIHILPWLMFVFHPRLWAVPFALLIVCRLLTARALREPASALPGQVAGSLIIPVIAARSLFNHRRNRLEWKGRLLNTTNETKRALPEQAS